MAIQFALAVRRNGGHPVVYALDEGLAGTYSIESTRSVTELIRGAAFCVFGGGSLLSEKSSVPTSYDQAKQEEYDCFRWALVQHACPLYFLSIGGDGQYAPELQLAPYREKLLQDPLCRYATVRTQADLPRLTARYHIPADYYPDVLLDIGSVFNPTADFTAKTEMNIGLNLPRSYRWFAEILCMCARAKGNVTLHFLSTVRQRSRERKISEILPRRTSRGIQAHPYDDPRAALRVLESLDLVVSSKLHLGLTALSIGVPFISLQGPLKCREFLRSVGSEVAYWSDARTWKGQSRLLRTLLSKKRIERIRNMFDFAYIEEQKRESRGHIRKLDQLICAAT